MLDKIKLLVKDPQTFIARANAKLKYRIWFQDNKTRRFIQHNYKKWGPWKQSDAKSIILFDFYPFVETEIARSYLLNILAKKNKAKIVSYSTNRKHDKIWDKIYRSYNVNEHISIKLSKEQKNRSAKLYCKIISRVKSKKDIFNLKVDNVWIGVDLYEEFLMKFIEPTVVLDKRMYNIVRDGIDSLVYWKDYFEVNDVKAIVSSHIGVRIEKNLPLKIAGQLFNIPFYSTHARNITCYLKPHLYHKEIASNYLSYPERFYKLSYEEQKKGIAWAKNRLKKRLSGAIGVDMDYSTKSAFSSVNTSIKVVDKNDRIKIVVATHEFYDSPNCYGGLLFMDFYEWLMYLGEISKKTNYDWYIKTHPDVLPITKKVIKKIANNHPKFKLLPAETSFHQLASEGVEYVLTCYGSVGHECPLLGMKVINAGNNPHMGHEFNWNPKSVEEYETLLLNLDKLCLNIDYDDIYKFYYIHYQKLGIIDDWIYPSYKKMTEELSEEERFGSFMFQYFLNSLTEDKHEKIILRMTEFIEEGRSGSLDS